MPSCACYPRCSCIFELLLALWTVSGNPLRRQRVDLTVINRTKLHQPAHILLPERTAGVRRQLDIDRRVDVAEVS